MWVFNENNNILNIFRVNSENTRTNSFYLIPKTSWSKSTIQTIGKGVKYVQSLQWSHQESFVDRSKHLPVQIQQYKHHEKVWNMFKVNNQDWCQQVNWCLVTFGHILHLFLVFLLFSLRMHLLANHVWSFNRFSALI